ncbi:PRA1 family protein F3-like [Musa acuminata AAA Group]|uniref:PRA1 family protein F3-like n=1 Tax=Musa acuminata AAA Group TaxID=214697 RepID=UPI0031E0AD9C
MVAVISFSPISIFLVFRLQESLLLLLPPIPSPEMTTYETLPISTSSPGFVSLTTWCPWRELADVRALGRPAGLGEAYIRIRTNAARFSMNYAIIVLLFVFLSLLWHPLSLIVFVASMAAWLFFYFLRGEPLVVLGWVIRDRVVLMGLAVVTLVPLLKTNATANILTSLSVGLLLVVVHAALRRTDYAIVEAEGPCYAAVGSAPASVQSSR